MPILSPFLKKEEEGVWEGGSRGIVVTASLDYCERESDGGLINKD
jgi:hypothetical protein